MLKRKRTLARMMAMLLAVILICSCAIIPASASGSVAAQAANAVVRILVMNPLTGEPFSFGSGFGIAANETDAPQYFVTNLHVVTADVPVGVDENNNLQYVSLPAVQIYIMKSDMALVYNGFQGEYNVDSSQLIPCEVVYASEDYPDMAIIRAAEPFAGRSSLPLRIPEESVDRGNTVYALGFPGVNDDTNVNSERGQHAYPADVEDVSITTGVFSHMAAMPSFGNYVHIEHDARINHGNSGGPLIDSKGAVLGINTYGLTSSSVTSFYAVSSEYIVDVCEQKHIPYRLATESSVNYVQIGVIAAAVLIVVVALFLVLKLQKKGKKSADKHVSGGGASAPVGLQIQAINGVFAGKTMTVSGPTKFGRRGGVNQVQFPENIGGVSGEHCQIYQDMSSGQYYILDLNSTYGTYVNNQKIAPNTPVMLQHGTTFHLGSHEQSFRVL